jgi:hypothetical protein
MINGKGFKIDFIKDTYGKNELCLLIENSLVSKSTNDGWSKEYVRQDIAIPLETALEVMKTLQELLQYAEEEEDKEDKE